MGVRPPDIRNPRSTAHRVGDIFPCSDSAINFWLASLLMLQYVVHNTAATTQHAIVASSVLISVGICSCLSSINTSSQTVCRVANTAVRPIKSNPSMARTLIQQDLPSFVDTQNRCLGSGGSPIAGGRNYPVPPVADLM